MNRQQDEEVPLPNSLVIFVAFQVGGKEFLYFLKTMADYNLIDRLLVIGSPGLLASVRTSVRYSIADNFKSLPGLIGRLDSWSRKYRCTFSGVIGIDEEEQYKLSRKIAGHFGLEFFNETTCSLASNKYLMKKAFRENGVPTGKFALVRGPGPDNVKGIGFPNVLKIISGTQSEYVFLNRNPDELHENFAYLLKAASLVRGDCRFKKQRLQLETETVNFNPRTQFLLEEYVPGEEFSCDFIKHNDEIKIIRVVKKIRGGHFGMFKGYHLLNKKGLAQNDIDLEYLREICRRIALAFSIDNGVCMVDFKMNDGALTVLESSIRPGLSAFNHLMYEIYGYTSLALMVTQKMGMKVDVGIPEVNGAVVYLYALKSGMIGAIDTSGLEELRYRYNILDIYKYEDLDDWVNDSRESHTMLLRGYVLLKSPDESKLVELANLFNEKVQITQADERANG